MLPIQAAPFLRQVMQQDVSSSGSSAELSAEQFTLAKEKERRARGAEIITVDQNYQSSGAGGAGPDGAYRPKVATWGVFPRPANISREYGGGRTLRPGEVCSLLARVKQDDVLGSAETLACAFWSYSSCL